MNRRSLALPLRFRLTIVYSVTFLICGGALLVIAYALMAQSLGGLGPVTPKVVSSGPPHADGTVTLLDGRVVTVSEYRREAAADERMQVQARAAYRRSVLDALLVRGGIALAVVTPIAIGLCWLAAGRGLRPLRRMAATARHVAGAPAASGLAARVPADGPRDEVRELAEAFNAMLIQLDESFAAQRRFVANAAHELRTPLAIDRTVLEVALDGPDADVPKVREHLLAANARQARMLDGLLALARSEHRMVRREPVDLANLIAAELDAANTTGLQVRRELAPAPVTGEATLLSLLARNLIGNAIRYNIDGGLLSVTVATGDDRVVLTVANTGLAVRASDLPQLFEPFRRGTPERTRTGEGAGLGLSIVQAIARAHDGTVAAEPGPRGGLTVQVTLPAAGAPTHH